MINVVIHHSLRRWVNSEEAERRNIPYGNWLLDDVADWLDQNIGPGQRVVFRIQDPSPEVRWFYCPPDNRVFFHSANDALLFKLTWGGR